MRVVLPQRDGHHRHIVDTHGPHQHRPRAQTCRQKVLVRIHLVVDTQNRFAARQAHFELDCDHGHAGQAHRVDMLHAFYGAKLLLQRKCHQAFHIAHRSARKGHEYIGERNVDLRLFFTRRDEYRNEPEQQAHHRQNRCERVVLKGTCKSS